MHIGSLFPWLCWAAFAAGCATPAVGDPCLPEQVPEDGFDDSEAYVESSSVQCEARVCLVDHLEGDPREGCDDRSDTVTCAKSDEVDKRVYCSCRCDSDDTGFAECEYPGGFTCAPVLEQGNAGVRGGYCIRNSSLTP